MGNRDERIKKFYYILNRWLYMKERGEKIGDYLKKQHIRRVTIYGMGDMARHLINELKGSECQVVEVVDDMEEYYYDDIKTKLLDNSNNNTDIVIYTDPMLDIKAVEKIQEKMECRVCSIEKLIFRML